METDIKSANTHDHREVLVSLFKSMTCYRPVTDNEYRLVGLLPLTT